MSSGTYDVAIVGGGIIGAACAAEFVAEKLRAAVIEERGVGTGATNAGMGHLLVLDDSEPQLILTSYSLTLWDRLSGQLAPECQFWRCGTVWVAEDEQELDAARERCGVFRSHGVAAQLLDASGLAEAEPRLRPGFAGGLLVTGDAAIVPPRVAKFLFAKARERGAEIIFRRAIRLNDDGLLLSDGSTISAAAYINAAGTAAALLTPGLPIRARKGHIVVLHPPPDFARHQVMELGYIKSAHAGEEQDSVAFAVRQNRDGELLVGSSRQYGSNDPQVEPRMIERMLDRAIAFMPDLAGLPELRSWAGFRAGTPDGLPLIGLCPGSQRVYAATGHEGLGATTSLATARLLVDAILNREPEISAAPYLPSRFAAQEL